MIKLIVGLGNPGPEYAGSRHNVGFFWTDLLSQDLGFSWRGETRFQGLLASGVVDGSKRLLLQPQTFMNLSGQSVASLAAYFKILPEEILVVHDEMDLPPGHVKLKFGGGHAGHNGLRDIHARLGTDKYWRLRLGIGHPGGQQKTIGWVLGRPSADDQAAIDAAVGRSLDAVDLILAGDLDTATQRMHSSNP